MKFPLILFVFVVSPRFVLAQSELKPFDIELQCKNEAEFSVCRGQCKDGWSTACYFDFRAHNILPNHALALQKEKCFGFYDMSVCAPCKNEHLIDGQEVDCKKFYQSINAKNKECNCLRESATGGG